MFLIGRSKSVCSNGNPARLAAATVTLAADVVQEQVGSPGAEDPEHLVLRQQVGLRRANGCDTATAALVGACDGRLTVGTLVAAVHQVLGDDGGDDGIDDPDLLAQVRVLIEAGVLTPSLTASADPQ